MALSGNEVLQVLGAAGSNPAASTQQTTTQAIAALGASGTGSVVTALTTVGAGTITAAGIVGKNTQRGGAQASAAFTDTTDTAANIIAALPSSAAVGTSFDWTYLNLTNAPATLTNGSGVTLSNISVVPPNSFADFLVTYSAAGAVTMVGKRQGFLPNSGTITLAGTALVVTSNTNITSFSLVSFTIANIGGTVGAVPTVKSKIVATSFTAAGTVGDTSTYNFKIEG